MVPVMRYGITALPTTYGQHLEVWSGEWFNDFECDGFVRSESQKQITLTDYIGQKLIVRMPEGVTLPRTEENYKQVDAAITAALNAAEWR